MEPSCPSQESLYLASSCVQKTLAKLGNARVRERCGLWTAEQSAIVCPLPSSHPHSGFCHFLEGGPGWAVGEEGCSGRKRLLTHAAGWLLALVSAVPEGGKLCRSLRQAGLGRQKRAGRDLFDRWGGRGSGRARAALQREWQGWLASNLSPDLAGLRGSSTVRLTSGFKAIHLAAELTVFLPLRALSCLFCFVCFGREAGGEA